MSPFADLHIHTHFSDSTSSPEEVVAQAQAFGLSCISITDHDTFEGVVPTKLAASPVGLEVITGIELSSDVEGRDIHILGYFFDQVRGPLLDELDKIQQGRVDRIKIMISKLKSLGLKNIEEAEVLSLTKSRSVGRLHLATIMLQKGYVTSVPEAFQRFIGENGPAYADKFKVSTYDAIKLIKDSGGLSVLAHPLITNRDQLIPGFVEAGLDGIEVYYPRHSPTAVQFYENIAEKHGLLKTGGSDAHGQIKHDSSIGKTKISYELVQRMKDLRGVATSS